MSALWSAVDLSGVAVVVVAAVAWMISRFRSGAQPACHQTGAPLDEAPPQVIVGASLQRGLQRARARKSDTRVKS